MDQSIFHSEASVLLKEYTHLEQDWKDAGIALQKYVLNLLENDLPALYQLLYKIDIDEKKASDAFGSDTVTIANNLTKLILQRILQKAESRLKYKS